MSRQPYRAILAPLVASLVIFSTDIHAAWDLTFPFYHEELTQLAPQQPVPTEITPPVVVKPAVPASPQQPAPQTPPPDRPDSTQPSSSPSIVIIHPPEPDKANEAVTPSVDGAPDRRAPFADAKRIAGTVYREDVLWQEKLQLDGWITIAPQATLTIAPGTTLRMATGSGIHVLGRIVVKGTPENMVLITSLSNVPSPGEWRGIVLSGSEKRNILDYLRIEGATTALLTRFSSFSSRGMTITSAVTGLQLQESVASMGDGRISGNGNGIVADNSELTLDMVKVENNRNGISLNSSSLLASNVTLMSNRQSGLTADGSQVKLDRFTVSGSETGARLTKGEGTITASIFRDNSEAGAVLSASRIKLNNNRFTGNRIGLQVADHLPVLWGNAFIENKSYNLLYLGEEIFYAGGNWFGSASRENSERTIFSKYSGAVQTEPLLTADPLSVD